MSARIAGGLAVAAMLMSVAAVIVAVLALTEDTPALSAPTKDEPGAYTKLVVAEAIRRYERDGLEASIDVPQQP